jgi:hypothetical protein
MVKFDNYVFLTICESSLDRFKFSQYSTYYGYCRTLNLSLKSGNLDKKEIDDVIKITNDLILIYGFDDKTCGKYIAEYFDSDRYVDFQKIVIATRTFFNF